VFLLNNDVELVAASTEEQQSARYFSDYLQKHCYKQMPNEERTAHQRLVTLDSVYLFNPVPKSLLPEAVKNIIGGQGCLWTEYFPTTSKVEYALFPRMSAIAETYWSGEERKDLDKFKRKLSKQFDRYDLWGTQYSTYVIETGDVRRR
jgi:N-acetyl-beta-hexosaminidase